MKLLIFMTKIIVFCTIVSLGVGRGMPAWLALFIAYAVIVLSKEAFKKLKTRKEDA